MPTALPAAGAAMVVITLALGTAACTDTVAPPPPLEVAAAGNAGGMRLFRVEPSMFPFYSRTEQPGDVGGFAYRTEEWAALVFYRDPSCIPDDFNLFDFYDFTLVELAPGEFIPRVFLCPATVSGFSLHHEPAGVTPPKQSNLSGSAVPIWFVPWSDAFQAAVAAGHLAVAELDAMGAIRGTATHYREVLQSVEAHPQPKIAITSHGSLEDGRRFHFNATWVGLTVNDVQNVRIRFR